MPAKLLREPLVHFLLIGAGLFVLFGLLGDAGERPDRIVLTRGEFEQLVVGWQRTWRRPPTEAELAGLVNDWVREQVYSREAIALGLDENDTVIRRRLRQKIEFLVDDMASAVPPTDEELEEFLNANPERFREPARVTFRQVYVSVDRRGPDARPHAGRLLEELRQAGGAIPDHVGDPLPIDPDMERASERDIARLFGEEFGVAVSALKPGDWQGPIASGYGLHLVQVSERTEPRMPALGEVRAAVERELRVERRREVDERFYEAIRARYEVVLEDALGAPAPDGGGDEPYAGGASGPDAGTR